MAKKAVDSTFRKILTYTAEIVASILLLIFICLPLALAVPGWIQHVLFSTPKADLLINPALWFGADGALVVIVALAILGLILGYPATMKLITREGEEKEEPVEAEDTKEEEAADVDKEVDEPVESTEEVTEADIETEEATEEESEE